MDYKVERIDRVQALNRTHRWIVSPCWSREHSGHSEIAGCKGSMQSGHVRDGQCSVAEEIG